MYLVGIRKKQIKIIQKKAIYSIFINSCLKMNFSIKSHAN